jgi:hypothetical protein
MSEKTSSCQTVRLLGLTTSSCEDRQDERQDIKRLRLSLTFQVFSSK